MSEYFDTFEEADDETMGVHVIDLVEIPDVSEEQIQESEEEEREINNREKLRRRLCEAETFCRQKRENRDKMFGDGLQLDKLINDMEAENKYLTSKVKELQQQLANIRKRMEEEDEEGALWQETRIVENQLIYIRKTEKEIKKLKEKNKDLTAELDQLYLGEKCQEKIRNVRRAEQEFKHKLEEIQEVLHSKDEEIEMKSTSLINNNIEIEEYFNTIEQDVRQEQRELREQLSNRQEEQMFAALNMQEESTTRETQQPLSSPVTDEDEEHKDEKLPKPENWGCCAKGLWKGVKAAGVIIFSVLLPVEGLMAAMLPVCYSPDPNYNIWNIALDLLEPHTEHHQTHPPVVTPT